MPARRVSRSMDNYKTVVETLATNQTFPEFEVDTLFEIVTQHPLRVKISFEGGALQTIRIHNYFLFTPPSDQVTSIQVQNTHTANNEIRMFIA